MKSLDASLSEGTEEVTASPAIEIGPLVTWRR